MGEPFENTEAWKSTRLLANLVYTQCRREPLAKDFDLHDQLQRAAVSVMNNPAERWESLLAAEKRQACDIARRSCGEVRSMSFMRSANQFITPAEQTTLIAYCVQSGKLISGPIRSLGDR